MPHIVRSQYNTNWCIFSRRFPDFNLPNFSEIPFTEKFHFNVTVFFLLAFFIIFLYVFFFLPFHQIYSIAAFVKSIFKAVLLQHEFINTIKLRVDGQLTCYLRRGV